MSHKSNYKLSKYLNENIPLISSQMFFDLLMRKEWEDKNDVKISSSKSFIQ